MDTQFVNILGRDLQNELSSNLEVIRNKGFFLQPAAHRMMQYFRSPSLYSKMDTDVALESDLLVE